MWAVHDQCFLENAAYRWPTSVALTPRALEDVVYRFPMPMSPSRCTHVLDTLCSPWLMLPVIGRRRLPDAHLRGKMFLAISRH